MQRHDTAPAMNALLARAALPPGLLAASNTAATRLVAGRVGDDETPQVMQPAVDAYRAHHPSVTVEVRDVVAKAFVVLDFRQAMQSAPDERVNAGTLRICWSIVLPMLLPALALVAIGIPVALGKWNNFLWPLLVVNDAATLPPQLVEMAGDLSFNPQSAAVPMAGLLLTSLPAIVLFFLAFQRQFVAGLQAGATKG